ncbi:MAG: hypothetical protein J6Z40_13100 [Oscillospiraceae bacterium]|nr:hypothetical protein [Oscillospiraceae bacterium]
MRPNEPQPDADALAAMLDELMAQGTQHINLTVGDQTRIQTVNSTECSPKGACAVPNFELNDEDPDAETPSDD